MLWMPVPKTLMQAKRLHRSPLIPITSPLCATPVSYTHLDVYKRQVIGRSNIVGKPAALLLLAKNATVTVCHSQMCIRDRSGRERLHPNRNGQNRCPLNNRKYANYH